MLNVTILCGNPKPASRTLRIARTLVESLLAPGAYNLTIIDLADHAGEIFAWPSESMAQLGHAVAGSDLLVVASPTYKASYTGLLKGFLDRYRADGLAGVVAIPVMTGGDLTHSMAPDTNLRPLLIELGASTPTRSLYFVMSDMERLDERVDAWAEANAAALRRVAALTPAVREHLPQPLAPESVVLGEGVAAR